MQVSAGCSNLAWSLVTGPPQPVRSLGGGRAAWYWLAESGSVLTVLSHDAARLPRAMIVSTTSGERPLDQLAHPAAATTTWVGAGQLTWAGPAGTVTVVAAHRWRSPLVASRSLRSPDRLGPLADAGRCCDLQLPETALTTLAVSGDEPAAQFRAVATLLGCGPGLTPAGDDVVVGYLLGRRALGLPVVGATAAVGKLSASATTALSAQLLGDAVHGNCIPQVADLLTAAAAGRPVQPAIDRLLVVGHTSGAALARGLWCAATGQPARDVGAAA